MGRDNRKKVREEQVELKDIPITWTQKEIVEAYARYGTMLRIVDRNIHYETLRRPFADMMNGNFKKTRAYLDVGSGLGYYFVSKDRLEKYLEAISEIFKNDKQQCHGDEKKKISKAVLRKELKKYIQEKGRQVAEAPCVEVQKMGLCSFLDVCRNFQENKGDIEQSRQYIEGIGKNLKDMFIINRIMDWNSAMDILFENDSVSSNEVCEAYNTYTDPDCRTKWRRIIESDVKDYKKKEYIDKILKSIKANCTHINGIRFDNMIQKDQELVGREILKGAGILQHHIDKLECLRKLEVGLTNEQEKDGDSRNMRVGNSYMKEGILQEEWEIMCKLYVMKSQSVDSKDIDRSEVLLSYRNQRELHQAMDQIMTYFEENFETFIKLEENGDKFEIWDDKHDTLNEAKKAYRQILDDCRQNIFDWLDQLCYVMKRVIMFREFEKELDGESKRSRRGEKVDAKTQWEEWEKLYDSRGTGDENRLGLNPDYM